MYLKPVWSKMMLLVPLDPLATPLLKKKSMSESLYLKYRYTRPKEWLLQI